MKIICCIGIVIVFTIFSGFAEGYLDGKHKNWDKVLPLDEHIYYTIIRVIFGIIMITICLDIRFILVSFLQFPFLHDGIYYTTRNTIDKSKPYKKGWFSQGDNKWRGFNPIVRTLLFAGAVIITLSILSF